MWLASHAVLLLVALMFTLFTWLGGGIVAPWLTPWTPWLTLLLAETALLLPEQKRTETLFDARKRVWQGIIRDPLTWISLALILFLVIQWVNACTFLEWNVAEGKWDVVSPAFEWLRAEHLPALRAPANPNQAAYYPVPNSIPCSWLPWSFHAGEAWGVLNWFPPVLIALLAVRHAMLKRTRRLLATYICAMTGVLAIAGIIQYVVGGDFLYWGRQTNAFFFATFGYPNHAACYFPAVMLLAIGMMLWTHEHPDYTRLPSWIYGSVVVLCGISSILSGSRAGMLFALAVIAFAVIYIPIRYFGSWSPKLRFAIPFILLLAAGVLLGTAGFRVYAIRTNQARQEAIKEAKTPEEKQAATALPSFSAIPSLDKVLLEIADTPWDTFFENPMLMRSGYQGILALRQYDDHPWYGTGAWSFRWLNASYINRQDPEEAKWFRSRLGVGQANVHNDTLQFMAEHGRIGFGLMLAVVACLVLPFLKALFTSPSHVASDEQADRCWLNRINVYCVFAFAATALIAAHSFIDLVFRSPSCMMLYGLLFVCTPGFITRKINHSTSTN